MGNFNKSAPRVSVLYYRILSLAAIFIMILNGIAIFTYLASNRTLKTIAESKHVADSFQTSNEKHTKNSTKFQPANYRNRRNDEHKQVIHFQEIFHAAKIEQMLTHKTRTILASNSSSSGDYPSDLFSEEQRKDGAITLHVIGVLYMFLGLALVCDEFFVPALHIISTMLKISDDVAGATFMAAGGSAPELFISVIGVFFTNSNVGFGTIVGSAVFNVLFVIGMCAIFSKTLLRLTWWPLLRDSSFYILALVLLITFFHNQLIEWWESLILFLIYFAYVTFMFFNETIEKYVKKRLNPTNKSTSSVQPLQEKRTQMLLTLSTTLAKNTFRNGALQLVIHTLDPIAEVTIEHKFQTIKDQCDYITKRPVPEHKEKETAMTIDSNDNGRDRTASEPVRFDSIPVSRTASSNPEDSIDKQVYGDKNENNDQNESYEKFDTNDTITNANQILKELDELYSNDKKTQLDKKTHTHGSTQQLNESKNNSPSELPAVEQIEQKEMSSQLSLRGSVRFSSRSSLRRTSSKASLRSHRGLTPLPESKRNGDEELGKEEQEEEMDPEDEPLDLSWPDTTLSRIYFIIKLPLLLLLVITLPDVRRPNRKKLFPITFIGSILWIGGFTYLMVWWTAEIGTVAGINIDVMGLTFLAAGTSIPDLITSVVVARQGLGDMAVSSSIGSNIFDVTVGLPLPWLIHSFTKNMAAVSVQSDGLFCSTVMLFLMLIAVIMTIAINKWKMTTLLGATMFLLYVVFITVTLLIQLNVWPCPI